MPSLSRWPLAVAVLAAGAVLVVSQLYLTVPLLAGIAARYSVPMSTAAWVGGGFGLAFAVGSLLFGTASDRFDRRHVMAAGLVACAVVSVVAGAGGSFELLLIARVAQGFVAAAFPAVALAHVADVVPADRRAVGVAAVSSGFLVAGLVGQGYALGVERALGWQWVFWLLVPLLLVTAVLVVRLPGGRSASAVSLAATFRKLGELVRRPGLQVAYVGSLSMLLTFVGMYTAFNAVVGERYGVHDPGVLLLLRLPGLPGIVLGACAGPLIARFGPHRVAATSLAVGAVGLVVEAFAGTLPLLLVGSAVFVAGIATTVPALVAVIAQASGDARGAGLAGHAFLIGLGAGIGPLLVTAIPSFAVLCLVLAAVLVVPAVLLGTRTTTRV